MAVANDGTQAEALSAMTTGPIADGTVKEWYADKRVLVTGGRGFLGSHLCRALVSLGAQVHAVGRTPPAVAVENPQWHAGDVSIMSSVESVLEASRPDVVFHLAGDAVGSRDLNLIHRSVQGELIPAINILTAIARRGSSRLVLAASLEEPVSAQAAPSSPYAAAKWSATGFARMFHLLYGTPLVITRPFMTYGPAQRVDKLVPHVLRAIIMGETPRLSSGQRMVDWVFVDDVVLGLLLAGSKIGIEGEELDLGSGHLVSVREVVELLVRATGSVVVPHFGALPDRPHEVERCADTAATYTRIGWRAKICLEDGLQRTVAWYRAQKWNTKNAS